MWGDLRQNSGECMGGSREYGVVGSPKFAKLRQASPKVRMKVCACLWYTLQLAWCCVMGDFLPIFPQISLGNGKLRSTSSMILWEKLNRGVSKPGCLPLFSGKVQIVSRTLSGLFLVGALNRPRKRKRTNWEKSPDHPRANRENPGKIGKVPKKDKTRTKKEGQVQIRNPLRLKHPRLAALEFCICSWKSIALRINVVRWFFGCYGISENFDGSPEWSLRPLTSNIANKESMPRLQ